MALTKELKQAFDSIDQEFGNPIGTSTAIAKIESDFDPNAKAKGSSASGMFQLLKGTAKYLGVKNPEDPIEAARGAAKYIAEMRDMFDGDIRKAILGYHAGPGNVKKYGLDTSQMPKTVSRNYLQSFSKAFQKQGGYPLASSEDNLTTVNDNTKTASSNQSNVKPPSPEELKAIEMYKAYQAQQQQPATVNSADGMSMGDAVIDAQNRQLLQSDTTAEDVATAPAPDAMTNGSITTSAVPDQTVAGVTTSPTMNSMSQPQAPAVPVQVAPNVQPDTLTNAALGNQMPAANTTGQMQNNANIMNKSNVKPASPEELKAIEMYRAYQAQQQPAQNGNTNTQPAQSQPQAPAAQPKGFIVADGPDANKNDYFNKPNRSQFLNYYINKSPEEMAQLYVKYQRENNTAAINTINQYLDYVGEQKEGHPSMFSNFVAGVANTGNDMALKLGQGISYIKGKVTGDMSGFNELSDKAANEKAMREIQDRANPSTTRTVGEVAAGFAAPGGGILKGAGMATKVADRLLTGAAVGALSNPTTGNADNFLLDTAKDAAIGGTLNVVGGAIGDKIGEAIGNRVGRKATAERITNSPERQQFQQDVQDLGIRTLGSEGPNIPQDVTAKANALASNNQAVRDQVEKNLIGYKDLVTRMRDNNATVNSVDFIDSTAPSIRTHANDAYSPYQKDAKDLLAKATSTDNNDASNTLKNILSTQLLGNKIKSDELYQDAARALDYGQARLDLTNFRKALEDLNYNADNVINSTNNADIVKNIAKSYEKQGKATSGSAGKVFSDYDLKNTSQFVKELNANLGDAMKNGKKIEIDTYRDLKQALLKDMQDFSTSNAASKNNAISDFVKKEQMARQYNANNYQNIVNDKQFTGALDTNNIDSYVNSMLKNRQQLTDFMNNKNLPDEAKQTIRLATLNNLLNNSTKGKEVFSPETFVSEYKKLKSAVGGNNSNIDVIFDRGTAKNLDQFNNVMKNLNQFKAYATTNVPTGNKTNNLLEANKGNIVGATAAMLGSTVNPVVALVGGLGAKAYTEKMTNALAKAIIDGGNDRLILTLAHANPKSAAYQKALGDLLSRTGNAANQTDYIESR